MSEATVAEYTAKHGTREFTGRIVQWHGGGHATVETEDGTQVTGKVVREPLTVDGAQ